MAYANELWKERAACRLEGLPVEIFFGPPGAGIDPRAKAACDRCAVRPQCAAYARQEDVSGWWAGRRHDTRHAGPSAGIRHKAEGIAG